MGTQTPTKMNAREKSCGNATFLGGNGSINLTLVSGIESPIPSRVTLGIEDAGESWLRLEVTELRRKTPVSIGPIDHSVLPEELLNNSKLRFLPWKYVRERYPVTMANAGDFVGAIQVLYRVSQAKLGNCLNDPRLNCHPA